jgi:hypothetical protein
VNRLRLLAARAATLVLAAVLLHGLLRLGLKAFRYLVSPFGRDYGEGCVLAMVQLLHERGTYFTDLREYPFVHGNYPPVFIALLWPFHAAFGPSLLAPRAISLLATLALLAALFVLLRRVAVSAELAAALVGVALCPWFVQSWAPMGRVDMLAFFFSIAGLALAAGGASGKALPLFWLAFFTKQNAVLAPLAWLVHVALEGPPSRAWRAVAAYVVPLLALFGLLAAVTGGEAYRHLVPYTAAAEYEWGRMGQSYLELARVAWPLLVLIAAGLARAPRGFTSGPRRAIFIYWLLNLAGLATIAKAGAAQNYFIEPWLATVLMAATAITVLFDGPRLPWRAAVLAAVAAVALYTNAEGHRLPPPIRHPERARDFQDLWRIVGTTPGPILSENLSVLAVNGRPVLLEPFGMLLLSQKGLFAPDRLVADCLARRFPLIVSEHRLERIPGLGRCLETRYEPWQDLATYRLFRPRSAAE